MPFTGAVVLAISVLAPSLAVSISAQVAPPGSPSLPAGAAAGACVVAAPPNSLWSLARCCARDLLSDRYCRTYSKIGDFIILKDNSPAKPEAYLIIPTSKVTGIGDERIFVPPIAAFWAYGWQQARIYLNKPAVDTALAINSEHGRSQDQLHIHISCVRRDVARALAENDQKIGGDPAKPVEIPLGPQNHISRVIKVVSLTAESPFALAAAMPGAKAVMAEQSIAVVGSRTPGTYYVLDTYHQGDNPGAAEELLEQACRS
jgi:CDP-diacylglycerol pyrophosphatase